MNLYTPSYYHKFRCLASACPDSCCKEWEIDIDDDTAQRYTALPGQLGQHIRKFLQHTDDGWVMAIENGRCPMWRQDGLCEIQKQLGHDALSCVCREFPRLRHDYGDFAELGLELSCPEAARLILEESTCMTCSVASGGSAPEYDPFAMDILRRSRSQVLAFLDTSSLPVPQALAVLLLFAHEVQSQLDGGPEAVLEPDALLADAGAYVGAADPSLLLSLFRELEILTPQWRARLDKMPSPALWERRHLHFVTYGIYRYWYQAVSDYDLVCRIKFILASCLLIRSLGGDLLNTAQLFSKEIENDPDNVETLLDAAHTHPALTDVHLLSLLINS